METEQPLNIGDYRAALSEGLETVLGRLHEWFKSGQTGAWEPSERTITPDKTFPLARAGVVPVVVSQFLARQSRCAEAISILARQGHAVEAQPILRAMIETAIDLRYIATNPQTLATKWARFENKWRYKISRSADDEDRPGDFGHLERQLDLEVAALNRHSPKKKGKLWKRTDLLDDWDYSTVARRDKASTAVWEDGQTLYSTYRIFSDFQHGSIVGAQDMIVVTTDGRVLAVPFAQPERKQTSVLLMTLHMLWLSAMAAKRCGAPLDPNMCMVELGVDLKTLSDVSVAEFQTVRVEQPG